MPEGLELVVPRLAEERVDLVEQGGVAERRLHDGGLEAVLGDEDVAVRSGDGVEDAEIGRAGEPRALRGARRLLGDLEAEVVPPAQRRGNRRRRAGRTG